MTAFAAARYEDGRYEELTPPIAAIMHDRIFGTTRIGTSLAIAEKILAQTGEIHEVVLANGWNYADALAGTAFAVQRNAPILLTDGEYINEGISDALFNWGIRKVWILGGEMAVNNIVEGQLEMDGYEVERLSGETRYDTAAAIASKLDGASKDIFIVSGESFPDALSIAPVAGMKNAAVLFARANGSLPDASKEYLEKHPDCDIKIIGGPNAVDEALETELDGLGLTEHARIFGENRYVTSCEVYEEYADIFDSGIVTVASGIDFPDALAGAVCSALNHAPILFSNGIDPQRDTEALIDELIYENKCTEAYIYGGPSAVSDYCADVFFIFYPAGKPEEQPDESISGTLWEEKTIYTEA